jgi:rhodanese-related sulfurtransferase
LGDNFVADAKKFDKTKPVFVYCKVETQKKATEKLNELGFQNIYELDGGFMKWSDEGLNNAKE